MYYKPINSRFKVYFLSDLGKLRLLELKIENNLCDI